MERRERGFTLIELLVVISIIALLIGILLPAIGKARDGTLITKSLSNLKQFGVAHATYASEWEGRQWTTCPDDFSLKFSVYQPVYPPPEQPPYVPAVPLGFDKNGLHHQTSNHIGIVPMWHTRNCSIGSFRFFHFKPFNQYINGKVHDQIFWAPKDYTLVERTHEWAQDPGEWPADYPMWPHQNGRHDGQDHQSWTFLISSYCTSVAAQMHPDVWRGPSRGGYQNTFTLPAAHRSPNLGAARYPDLKSHMLEHRWLQNPPSPHIPNTQYGQGVPWFYNMGADSTPATLFFDGHIRMMSTREAVRSSRRVVAQGDDPLVVFESQCFGSNGYFEYHAYGDQNEINSWHVFTRDGILGRDTLGDG